MEQNIHTRRYSMGFIFFTDGARAVLTTTRDGKALIWHFGGENCQPCFSHITMSGGVEHGARHKNVIPHLSVPRRISFGVFHAAPSDKQRPLLPLKSCMCKQKHRRQRVEHKGDRSYGNNFTSWLFKTTMHSNDHRVGALDLQEGRRSPDGGAGFW